MKRVVILLFLLAFTGYVKAQTVYPDYVDGVIYVKTYDTTQSDLSYSNPSPALSQIISDYSVLNITRAFVLPDISMQHVYRMNFSDYNSVDNMIAACSAMPGVEYAEKAPLIALNYVPNDYNSNMQWNLQKIQATGAWNFSTGSSAVKIAIVDNAVNWQHEDLVGNAWTNPGEIAGNGLDDDLDGFIDDMHGYDVADLDNNPKPPPGTLNTSAFVHGTHCAGIASATTDNVIGISSIAFRAQIISVKCSPDTSNGNTLRATFEGVDYAMSAGADVISMSFGSPTGSLTWQVLINAAMLRNIVMVAAAGNNGTSSLFYPAANPYVIAVGATNQNDEKASYSNYGSWIDVMAPGSGIYSTLPQGGNTYGYLSGTSMACPLVAGLAGLVLSVNQGYTEAQVENIIKGGCQNIDAQNPSYVGLMGTGRINALQSMLLITGLNEEDAAYPFTIYPNPGNGEFFLQPNWHLEAPVKLDIYDPAGRLVSSQVLEEMNRDGRVQLRISDEYPAGVYSLIFNVNDKLIETEKLVITRE
jgi:subtilisin family serine protease